MATVEKHHESDSHQELTASIIHCASKYFCPVFLPHPIIHFSCYITNIICSISNFMPLIPKGKCEGLKLKSRQTAKYIYLIHTVFLYLPKDLYFCISRSEVCHIVQSCLSGQENLFSSAAVKYHLQVPPACTWTVKGEAED